MPAEWHDINDPGVFRAATDEEPAAQESEQQSEAAAQTREPEVELLSADTWEAGDDGYRFNAECFLTVNCRFLRQTNRTRLQADVWVRCNDRDEDLGQALEAFIDDNNKARFRVMLYYGDAYHDAAQTDPNAVCYYLLKNIRHAAGTKQIESSLLEMPVRNETAGGETLDLEIDIDPSRAKQMADVFVLKTADDTVAAEKSLRTDSTARDNVTVVTFSGLDADGSYSLFVKNSSGKTTSVFGNRPFGEWR